MNNINVVMPAQATYLTERAIRAKLPIMLHGSPGIGKSSIYHELARRFELELVDIRLSQIDPTELQGFPSIVDNIARYIPMDIFPLDFKELPPGKKGWLLFLDEFNQAPLMVQRAAYRLMLDREVGSHKLHPNVAMVAAGNLSTDNAHANELGTAMQSRLLHVIMKPDLEQWTAWANKTGLDHRVISFVNFKPELFHLFDPNHDDLTFPCPRTWEFAARLVKEDPKEIDPQLQPLLAGTVGAGPSVEFTTYCQIFSELLSFNDILANPEKVALPEEPATNYALTGIIANGIKPENCETVMKFVNRLDIEFQVLSMRAAFNRNNAILGESSIQLWAETQGRELLA